MGGLVSLPWLAHRQDCSEELSTANSPVFSHNSHWEAERTTKFSWIHQNRAAQPSRAVLQNWEPVNQFFHQDFQENRCVISGPKEKFSLCPHGKISRLLVYPSQTSSQPFSPHGEKHGEDLAQSLPLTHFVSSAQLTTELGTISRVCSSHGEDHCEI